MNTKAEKMVTTPELLSNDDVFGSMVRLSQDNMHTYDIDYDNLAVRLALNILVCQVYMFLQIGDCLYVRRWPVLWLFLFSFGRFQMICRCIICLT